MAFLIFSKAVDFPISGLRTLLSQHLPLFKWQCGEHDTGEPGQVAPFCKPQLIVGRTASAPVFVELRPKSARLDGPAPPHGWHVEIGEPTTEHPQLALRVQLAVAAATMRPDEESAFCQLRPGGNWLSANDVLHALSALAEGEDAKIEDIGIPPSQFGGEAAPNPAGLPLADRSPQARSAALGVDTLGMADLQRTFATILSEAGGDDLARQCGFAKPPPFADEGVREDRLPTMVLLLDEAPAIAWDEFAEGFGIIDPDGGWTLDAKPDGSATLAGRGSRIALEPVAEPLPAYLIEQAFARSFWFPDGEPRLRVRNHRRQLVMRSEVDTRAVPYEDVRQTAKVATLLLGLLAKQADACGLYNAGIETVTDAAGIVRLTGILHDDEIPIQMWTWTAPHSLQTDAVTLTTGGFAPFLGYEVEIWNAPGDCDFVAGQVNNALRYLLINGPIVNHGETMGEKAGDRSIRCFFGDSKAHRARPVRAMFLELRGPSAGGPHADMPIARPQPPVSQPPAEPVFGRRVGGFGRKGL